MHKGSLHYYIFGLGLLCATDGEINQRQLPSYIQWSVEWIAIIFCNVTTNIIITKLGFGRILFNTKINVSVDLGISHN